MARKQARFGQPAVYNASAPTLTDGDDSGLNVDVNGNLLIAGSLSVSSIASISTSVTPGTAAANLGKAEDAAHTSGDTGVMVLGVGNEAQSTFAADGDYIPHGVDTKGNNLTVGNVASAATDTGAPIKIGAKLNTTRPTFTDGQRGDLQIDTKGSLGVAIYGAGSTTGVSASTSGADGVTNTLTGINAHTLPRLFNGATWDRAYGDTTSGAYVNIRNGLMPAGTALNTYSVHLTSNTTTTPTASTAYVSSVVITSEIAGTTSTVTIQDKSGTPLKLINGFSTTALTTTPTAINFQTPIKMTSGIDIITAGAVAATVDIWINYYQ